MSGRMLLHTCASLLLVQSISALSCLAPQPSPCLNQAQPSLPINYLAAQSLAPAQALVPAQPLVPTQAAYLPQFAGGAGASLGLSLPAGFNEQQVLSVISGSVLSPSGINLIAENLEIGGLVEVQGAVPFLSAVGVAGDIPSGGLAYVSYNAGPGVELTSGGCGQGLGAEAFGSGLASGLVGNNVGLASGLAGNVGLGSGLANNVGLAGFGLANNVASGLGLANGVSSCGCRY